MHFALVLIYFVLCPQVLWQWFFNNYCFRECILNNSNITLASFPKTVLSPHSSLVLLFSFLQDNLHGLPIGGIGKGIRARSLPRRLCPRGAGHEDRAQRVKSPSLVPKPKSQMEEKGESQTRPGTNSTQWVGGYDLNVQWGSVILFYLFFFNHVDMYWSYFVPWQSVIHYSCRCTTLWYAFSCFYFTNKTFHHHIIMKF